MLNITLNKLFERDILRLINELNLYQTEANIWKVEPGITNSAGNLALHLIGNLNSFVGKTLGGTNYLRNRELEFSQKDIPRNELITKLEATLVVVSNTLQNLNDEDLQKEFPVLVFDEKTSTEYMLVHLTTHLAYHLGQINYHRRLVDK